MHFWKSFVPTSWMCKKQTAVSHSSTESEIISLDTGTEIGWVGDRSVKPESDDHKHHKSHNKIDVTKDIDAVLSNVQSAR